MTQSPANDRDMLDEAALENHARAITHIASAVAMRYFRGTLGVEFKDDESPVTRADRHVEDEVRAYLRRHFPEHGIFGEEHGTAPGDGRHLWVIDPIDGTRSFMSGHPLFGFLLAHLVDGQAQLGVVGMPALNETFVGIRGRTATLNGRAIRTSDVQRLDEAILYVNEADTIWRDRPDVFGPLMGAGQTRRFAHDCYPHALLAAGHVDAVIDYQLQPYDYLALCPLIEAAGGVITDWNGQALNMQSDVAVVAAATPQLHGELLTLLSVNRS